MISKRFQGFKFLYVLLIAATMLIPSASMAADAASDLEQRGKQLRMAIDKKYKELHDANAISMRHVNDITPLVLQYVPIGTSFDDADKILRAAGFGVAPHPVLHPVLKFPDGAEYDVLGRINPYTNPYIESGLIPTGTSLDIDLTPPSPTDYSKVSRVSAAFTIYLPLP
jgi:hypothetical protein